MFEAFVHMAVGGFAERWFRTVKKEALSRVNLVGIGGLRRVPLEYAEHYISERPHQGIENAVPISTQNVEEGE